MKNDEMDDFDKMLDDFIANQIKEYEKNYMNGNNKDTEKNEETNKYSNKDFNKLFEDLIEQLEYNDDEDDDNEVDTESCKKENIFPLGYQWIVENIVSLPIPNSHIIIDFMTEMSKGNIYEFKNLYLYQYYYRFIKPIEYNHPNYSECEESFWPLLFQLAFAERYDTKIIDRGNQLPDIELSYMFERRTIASLSLEEIKSLTLELATSAFYKTYIKVCDAIYSEAHFIRDDRPILKEELQFLYGFNHNTKKENIEFIDTIYNRITRCDVETMPYRFNENREIINY